MGALRSDPRAASLQLFLSARRSSAGRAQAEDIFPIHLAFLWLLLACALHSWWHLRLSVNDNGLCLHRVEGLPKDCSPKSALITCVILACLFTLSVVLARAGVPKERDDEIRGSVSMRMNDTWTKMPDAAYAHERSTPDPMLLWWQVMLYVALSCACCVCCTYTVWRFSNRPNCNNADISESSDSTSEDSEDMGQ